MQRQNNLEEEEKLFLHTCTKMLLHKHLRKEKMPSPHANPFYLTMDISGIVTEIKA